MRYLVILLYLTAIAGAAESAVISGRVLDRTGRSVSHARIRAFHAVPLIEHPSPGAWNGLLDETYSDVRGYFVLRTSGRASLDHLLVEGRGYFNVVSAPFPPKVRVVLSRKVRSPEEEVQQLLKRLHRKTPTKRRIFDGSRRGIRRNLRCPGGTMEISRWCKPPVSDSRSDEPRQGRRNGVARFPSALPGLVLCSR